MYNKYCEAGSNCSKGKEIGGEDLEVKIKKTRGQNDEMETKAEAWTCGRSLDSKFQLRGLCSRELPSQVGL